MPPRPLPTPQAPRAVVALLILTASLALIGCESTISDDDFTLLVSTDQMIEVMQDDNAVLVDVRDPEAYAAEHIPGAVNVPYMDIFARHPLLRDREPIVVYSRGWSEQVEDLRSWAAAKKLLHAEFNEVYDYRGGLLLWKKEGRPTLGNTDAKPPLSPDSDDTAPTRS